MEVTSFTDSGILPSASHVSPSSDTPLRGLEVAAVPKFVDADPMSDDFQHTSPKDDHAHHPPSVTDEDDKIPHSVDTQRSITSTIHRFEIHFTLEGHAVFFGYLLWGELTTFQCSSTTPWGCHAF